MIVPTTQDENQKRALLSAMAQSGTQAKADVNAAAAAPPTDIGTPAVVAPPAAPAPAAPAASAPAVTADAGGTKAQAAQAAAQRAALVNAPMTQAVQDAGQSNAVYDQASAHHSRSAAATAAQRASSASANGNYYAMLNAAKPIMQQRTQLAVQQILADKADRDAQNQYQRDVLGLNRDKFNLERQQFDATVPANMSKPLGISDAATLLNSTPEQVNALQGTSSYAKGREMTLNAAKQGMSLDEFKAQVLAQAKAGALGDVEGEDQLGVAKLLIAMYSPVFANKDEAAGLVKAIPEAKELNANSAVADQALQGIAGMESAQRADAMAVNTSAKADKARKALTDQLVMKGISKKDAARLASKRYPAGK